jgi:hypothetical protein
MVRTSLSVSIILGSLHPRTPPASDPHKKQTQVLADKLDHGDSNIGSNDVELDMPRSPPSPQPFYKFT